MALAQAETPVCEAAPVCALAPPTAPAHLHPDPELPLATHDPPSPKPRSSCQIVRRLLLHGVPSDAKTARPLPVVATVIPIMVQALSALLALRPPATQQRKAATRSHLLAMLERSLLKLLHTQCALQEAHPWSYHGSGMLLPVLEFCCGQVRLLGLLLTMYIVVHRGGSLLFGVSAWSSCVACERDMVRYVESGERKAVIWLQQPPSDICRETSSTNSSQATAISGNQQTLMAPVVPCSSLRLEPCIASSCMTLQSL